jgi:hypothetical protein
MLKIQVKDEKFSLSDPYEKNMCVAGSCLKGHELSCLDLVKCIS